MIPDEEDAAEMEFLLMWRTHGGSGLGLTREEYLNLDVDRRNWYLERVEKQREDEAKAIKQAAGSR